MRISKRFTSVGLGWVLGFSIAASGGMIMAQAPNGAPANHIADQSPAVVVSVTVSPSAARVIVGATQQFTATVAGTGNFDNSVTWSLLATAGSDLSPGTISQTGLFTTPYPAPASVTVVAASNGNSSIKGSVTITLIPPAPAAAPALTVDAGKPTHAISPYIYGMNAWSLAASVAKAANLPLARWGGDATSRYNYKLDVTNASVDFFFENEPGTGGDDTAKAADGDSAFDARVETDNAMGTRTMASVPVLGWVAKDSSSCGFPTSTYPGQLASDPKHGCGNGELAKSKITGNDPTLTSTPVGPSWAGEWVAHLVRKFGTASKGGVAIYGLDNEPAWWDANHRDVHPLPSTYDEVTVNGIATAKAIKAADPTAEVTGPVVDFYWNYYYSKKDIEAGWIAGPCHQPWSNPIDRIAHDGVPFVEYYLRQFAAYEAANKVRLLDYLDLHTYFVANYDGKSLSFASAGDTGAQRARLDSTRVFWDPTYTDPGQSQPNYSTDPAYTQSCKPPLQALQVIPTMQGWVAKDYPGTRTAITEYNWGGLEHVNGAIAQADILGIFGREGLDVGTLWGPPNPAKQVPGLMAFETFRNYDGAGAKFGEMALTSTSADQGRLSVYAALRSADGMVTIIAINKTYQDLTGTLSLANFKPSGPAKSWLFSNANLAKIVPQPDVAITAPAIGGSPSTLRTTFPAQSITILTAPKK